MDSLWVVIVSRFSPSCQKLMSIIGQNQLPIRFHVLSIDEKKMRDRIKADTRYNFKMVPCILNIDRVTGVANQYEGDKAFQVIGEILDASQGQAPQEQGHIQATAQMHMQPQPIEYAQPIPISSPPQPHPQVMSQAHPQAHSQGHPQVMSQAHPQGHPQVMSQNLESQNTPIDALILEDTPSPSVQGGKVSVASIMAERENFTTEETKARQPTLDFQPVKTGGKVNISEVMNASKQTF